MNELVREWIEKADADTRTAEREAAVESGPNWDAACFHAQQAIEKYLKANLQASGTRFEKIHDLTALLDSAIVKQPAWEGMRDDFGWLSFFAVEIRYPGMLASREDAQRAVQVLRRWRPMLCEPLKPKLEESESKPRPELDLGESQLLA